MLCLLIYGLFLLSIADAQIPTGMEPYSKRPDILDVEAKQHKYLGKDWEKYKHATMEMVAQILEIYSNTDEHLYFLARDGELMYDFAKLAAKDNPAVLSRIHLINISRTSVINENVMLYLEQEGISEETLRSGKKAIFIDSGFEGTIRNAIAKHFSSQLQNQLKVHLASSAVPDFPSSRVSLWHLDNKAAITRPWDMRARVIASEHIARHTNYATGYNRVSAEGRWEPVSPKIASDDTEIADPKVAIRYQEDIKFYFEAERDKFIHKSKLWRDILKQPKAMAIKKLKTLLALNPKNTYWEAFARDYAELSRFNLSHADVKLTDLKLENELEIQKGSNVQDIVAKYPQWEDILSWPREEIPHHIRLGKWEKLFEAIKMVTKDGQIAETIGKELGYIRIDEKGEAFIRSLIENADSLTMQALAKHTLTNVHIQNRDEFTKLLITKGDYQTHINLARHSLSSPKIIPSKDNVRLLIELGNDHSMQELAKYFFSKPQSREILDLMEFLIKEGSYKTHFYLASNVFSEPHTKSMNDLIELLINLGDDETWQALAQYAFSQSHTKGMGDLIKLLIEKGDPLTLEHLAKFVFSQPHTEEMSDLIKLLIENGNQNTRINLAIYTFSKPHIKKMEDLIKILINKSDKRELNYLIWHVFTGPHTANMVEAIELLLESELEMTDDLQSALKRAAIFKVEPSSVNLEKLYEAISIKNRQQRVHFLNSSTPDMIDSSCAGTVIRETAVDLDIRTR